MARQPGSAAGQNHAEVCTRGYNSGRNSFMQFYGSRYLDASVLLPPLVGFLPADDERIAATFVAVQGGLMEGGFVRRQEAPWLGKEEGVLDVFNDLGLLSEEFHVPSGRLLGNFPQALTHISVINTGLGLCGPTLQCGGG